MSKFGYFIVSFWLPIIALAQSPDGIRPDSTIDYLVEEFVIPGGQLNNNVNAIVQGPYGFLWFGSHGGLHRYDGHEFVTYKQASEDSLGAPNSLSFSYVENLYWDRFDKLWICTYGGGVFCFDPLTESFKRYEHDPENASSISNDHVMCAEEDADGSLWFGTEKGLNRFDRDQETFERYLPNPNQPGSLSHEVVRNVYLDKQGTLWIATGFAFFGINVGGLNRYVPTTNSFVTYLHDPQNPNSLWASAIQGLLEDNQGNFWIATAAGLQRMDRKTEQFERMVYHPHRPHAPGANDQARQVVFSLLEDRDGNLWIGTIQNYGYPSHLLMFNPITKEVKNFPVASTAWYLCQSADGTIWVAGAGESGKIVKISPKEQSYPVQRGDFMFEAFKQSGVYSQLSTGHDKDRLMGPIYLTFDPKNGSMWGEYVYDAHKGSDSIHYPILANYDKSSGKTQFFHLKELDLSRLNRSPYFGNFSPENHAVGMAVGKDGRVWGTYPTLDVGFYRFDPKTSQTLNYLHDPENENSLKSNYVIAMVMDKKGDIWLGHHDGINRFSPSTGKFTHYHPDADHASRIGGSSTYAIFAGTDGSIWAGGSNPLGWISVIHPDSGYTYTYSNFLTGTSLLRFFEQKGGAVYYGTDELGIGVIPLDQSLTSLKYYRPEVNGFPFRDVGGLVFDSQGKLWSGSMSEARFACLDVENDIWFAFRNEGGKALLNRSGILGPEGHIYFPSAGGGWVEIDPLAIAPPPARDSSRLQLVDLFVMGERQILGESKLLDQPIWNYEELKLPPKATNFGFRISMFNFRSYAEIYQCRLYPYEQEWRQLKEPVAMYASVPVGDYRFQVRTFHENGLAFDKIDFPVILSPPWWKTWWAYTLYGLCLFGLFYAWRFNEKRMQEAQLIRERKVSEQLRRLNALKDQFLANTSHELRTPLNGIIGLSESLIEEESDVEKRENLTMIISSGKRLANLVNDILDFSKLKNYDIQLVRKPISLHALTDIVLKNNSPLVKGKEILLVNSVSPDLPLVWADENRLQQVLYNLIGNAIKFTEKGEIVISGKRAQASSPGGEAIDPISGDKEEGRDWVEIRIQDTGIGIAEDKLEAIFLDFEQGDGSASRKYSGTGLGLSISKQLVELHGGNMWVESEVGKGSAFYFSLSVSKGQASTFGSGSDSLTLAASPLIWEEPELDQVIPNIDESLIHILVVDDEPINQQVFKSQLANKSFRLTQAMNGKEALEIIERDPDIDLVLLDVMMPRMSGYEVCQQVRERYLPSELPVIMITAKDQLQDIVHGLSLGANDYLPKPFHKEELLARINTQLDLRRIFSVAGRFVPNEFLHSLNRDRITEVVLGDHAEKEVSVLFSDIRDYTALAEDMTPEENFQFVNAFHGRMGPLIQLHQGFVNQYLGDAIMSIFPQSSQDALMAAIDMQRALHDYNRDRFQAGRQLVYMGLGLHSGSLIMGIIGDHKRMDAATISDTVNTASRIEGLTKYFGVSILLSEDSYTQISEPEKFHLRYLGQVLVKGKKDPFGIYECIDGDLPESLEKKKASLVQFNEGIQHFFARRFPEATLAFNRVLKANPEDKPAHFFLSRSSHYILEGVPDDWMGIEVMSVK